jgi:hypothetical protein
MNLCERKSCNSVTLGSMESKRIGNQEYFPCTRHGMIAPLGHDLVNVVDHSA